MKYEVRAIWMAGRYFHRLVTDLAQTETLLLNDAFINVFGQVPNYASTSQCKWELLGQAID